MTRIWLIWTTLPKLRLLSPRGGEALVGTATATAVAGIVSFADLSIGGTVGDRTLLFTAPGLTSTNSDGFSLTPGLPSQISLSGGDDQTGLASTSLESPFSVEVGDPFDNGVEGIEVQWSVPSGLGELASTMSITDSVGIATNTYTFGRFAGVDTINAAVSDLSGSPVGFSVTTTPNGTISGTITAVSDRLSFQQAAKVAAGEVPPAQRGARKQVPRPPLQTPQEGPPTGLTRAAVEYVPNELIVTFRPSPLSSPPIGSMAMASRATAQSIVQSMRAALAPYDDPSRVQIAGISPAVLAARIKVSDPSQLGAIMAQFQADPKVETVERNLIVRREFSPGTQLSASPILPNDWLYPYQAWHYAMMDLPEAWNITTGDASVLVAVVDDGINFGHPDIAANLTDDGYDFVSDLTLDLCSGGTGSNAGDGYDPDPTQPSSHAWSGCIGDLRTIGNHGLHVAGTIGAVGNDAYGASGVNWTVSIRPVRVLGVVGIGTWYDIAQGVLYAAGLPADDGAEGTVQALTGARIINMSLGGGSQSTVQENAVIATTDAGALIVASAGNGGTSDPSYPAAYPQTLSVSAVGPDGDLSNYSTFGSTVDIAAPGGDFADGDCSFGVISTAWNYETGSESWACWQGTSMAAPHVSGVAALVLAQNPGLATIDLKARLIDYAVDTGDAGRDDLYGWGIVNVRNSLTQGEMPTQQLFARLINAESGAVVQTVAAQSDGSYSFTEVADGDYFVFAGEDADGDQKVGIPGRRWGAFGSTSAPNPITVNGAGSYPVSFTMGYPIEIEPNDQPSSANVLPIGGYLLGAMGGDAGGDTYIIRIPTAGQYIFETSAVDGACGFALEEDTILNPYDSDLMEIANNDDIDGESLNFCSQITQELSPGTYYATVTGYAGSGRYVITVREGT